MLPYRTEQTYGKHSLPYSSALGLELSAPPGKLYYVDQARPTTVHRLWLDGGNTSRPAVEDGLSRPRALAFLPALGKMLLADSGTRRLSIGDFGDERPALVPMLDHPTMEARGLAVRADANVRRAATSLVTAKSFRSSGARSARGSWLAAAGAAVLGAALAGMR